MRQEPVRLGPFALLLTVISVCMAVLAVLSMSTAGADMRLSERYADMVAVRYELECEGQRYLAAVRSDPSEISGEPDESGVYYRIFENGQSRLTVGLRPGEGGAEVVCWKHERSWDEDTQMHLWQGKGN